jgi:hypothetical protein
LLLDKRAGELLSVYSNALHVVYLRRSFDFFIIQTAVPECFAMVNVKGELFQIIK